LIERSFFDRHPAEVAPELLGCTLHVRGCSGVIVETEAYHESEPSCHAFKGRTARTDRLFGPPGTAYVYFTYGMHWCFNIVTSDEGVGAAVLIRALIPETGIDKMRERRAESRKPGSAPLRDIGLCSGPAKLVQAMGITMEDNGRDLCVPNAEIHVEPGLLKTEVLVGPRIGISEAKDLPWRFGLQSPYLSRRF
jgi:DNA-3-methyladenine glycosylase